MIQYDDDDDDDDEDDEDDDKAFIAVGPSIDFSSTGWLEQAAAGVIHSY